MTTAPEQTTAATRASANASMPPAAPAPVAAPVAGYVGTVLALLMLGAGVIALRDGAVSAGWLDGRPFTTTFVGWLDGLSFAPWIGPRRPAGGGRGRVVRLRSVAPAPPDRRRGRRAQQRLDGACRSGPGGLSRR